MEVEAYRHGHFENFYRYIIDEPEIKATLFFTWKGLAKLFDVNENTVNRWKEKHEEFWESIKKGRKEFPEFSEAIKRGNFVFLTSLPAFPQLRLGIGVWAKAL